MNKTTNFLTFDEAVSAARKEPEVHFIGLGFSSSLLVVFALQLDAEDPPTINIFYSAAKLFDSIGYEDSYTLDDVPIGAKTLFYVRESDLNVDFVKDIFGVTSEYILHRMIPGLPDPDTCVSVKTFRQDAINKFRAFWRQQ